MAYMETLQELIEAPLTAEELAMRYRDLCENRLYSNLPGKIELDLWGRMVMSPASTCHGQVQAALCQRLAVLGGIALLEVGVVTGKRRIHETALTRDAFGIGSGALHRSCFPI